MTVPEQDSPALGAVQAWGDVLARTVADLYEMDPTVPAMGLWASHAPAHVAYGRSQPCFEQAVFTTAHIEVHPAAVQRVAQGRYNPATRPNCEGMAPVMFAFGAMIPATEIREDGRYAHAVIYGVDRTRVAFRAATAFYIAGPGDAKVRSYRTPDRAAHNIRVAVMAVDRALTRERAEVPFLA